MCRVFDELKERLHRPYVWIVVNVDVADIRSRNEVGVAFIEFCEKNGIVWNSDDPIDDLSRGQHGIITLRLVSKGVRAFFTNKATEATHYFDRENMDLLKLI